jgi:hydrogenase maturation protease
MPGVLIIGIGNPLRGDDSLGWRAVEQLRQKLKDTEAGFIVCHQLTPELAEAVSQAQRVVFIDALLGHPAGQLEIAKIQPGPLDAGPLGHNLDPATLLAYTRALYGVCPAAFAASITAERFDYSLELSETVHVRLPSLLDEVNQLVRGSGAR